MPAHPLILSSRRAAWLALVLAAACAKSAPAPVTARDGSVVRDDPKDTRMAAITPRPGPVCRYHDVLVEASRPQGLQTVAQATRSTVTLRTDSSCTATVALYPADGNVIEMPIGSGGAPEPIPLRGRQVVDRTITLTQRASSGTWSVELAQEDLDGIELYDASLYDFDFAPTRFVAVRLRKRTAVRTVAYDTRVVAEDPDVDRHDCKPSLLVVPYDAEATPPPAPSGLPADPATHQPLFTQVCSIEEEGVAGLVIKDVGWNQLGLHISLQAFGVAPFDVVVPVGDETVVVADVLIDVQ